MFRRFPADTVAFASALILILLGLMTTRSAAPAALLHAQQAAQPTQAELDAGFLVAWKQQTREKLNVPATGAKVVVVKFNDWMCPGCRAAAAAFKPLLDKYASLPGALLYVEDWPWNAS
jgi:protein-disulfide isomerase